jgi:plastocyanin
MNNKARLPLVLGVLAASATAAPAVASPTARSASTAVVKLQNVRIHPARLVIGAGGRVTWKFLDAPIMTEHTVTSISRKGGLRFKGTGAHMSGSYSVTFARRGTYYYECTIHPGMQGRVVVR